MRQTFAFSLLVTVTVSSLYIYHAGSAICAVPLRYHIGIIDDRFDVTAADISAAAAAAAAVWEAETDRELFVETADASSIAINFVFDERQLRVIEEAEQRARLDVTSGTAEAVQARYDQLVREYEALQTDFETRAAAYAQRLAAYNTQVEQYNNQGGAPEAVFAELQAEDSYLQAEGQELEQQRRQVNALVDQLNALGEQGNQLVDAFNREVGDYNRTFGETEEFTQGDFLGRDITVYSFTSNEELVAVLAHEFGHSLGIGHVENESSVMYYLLGEQPNPLVLSDEDTAAFLSVCGDSAGWSAWHARLLRIFA